MYLNACHRGSKVRHLFLVYYTTVRAQSQSRGCAATHTHMHTHLSHPAADQTTICLQSSCSLHFQILPFLLQQLGSVCAGCIPPGGMLQNLLAALFTRYDCWQAPPVSPGPTSHRAVQADGPSLPSSFKNPVGT